jgi:predicted transcriptional regulator
MHQNNIGSIIIVDNEKDGMAVGIITERDIIRVLGELQPWLMSTPLRSIMSKPLVTIRSNASLKDGIQTMYSRNIRSTNSILEEKRREAEKWLRDLKKECLEAKFRSEIIESPHLRWKA